MPRTQNSEPAHDGALLKDPLQLKLKGLGDAEPEVGAAPVSSTPTATR